MIKFMYHEHEGTIDHNGFVRLCGVGFHIEDVEFNKDDKLVRTLRKVLDENKWLKNKLNIKQV